MHTAYHPEGSDNKVLRAHRPPSALYHGRWTLPLYRKYGVVALGRVCHPTPGPPLLLVDSSKPLLPLLLLLSRFSHV